MQKNEISVTGPFFSIGVTTYNKKELLKQTLTSIINQTFTDFEVIVGNDYIRETLSSEIIGVHDHRIRFVNHSQNLGEVNNMNSLLEMSRGKYFTWQFDDDMYAPDFLEAVYSAIVGFDFPPCVYTSYGFIFGTHFPNIKRHFSWPKKLFTGRQFMRMSLLSKLKMVGCCGVFETESLRRIGGVEDLCGFSIGVHSEHLLMVKTGLLEKVGYVNVPLVLVRDHENSWSSKNAKADLYKQAGNNLIRESVEVFKRDDLRDDFRQNLSSVLSLSINAVLGKLIARDGHLNKQEMIAYIDSNKEIINSIRDSELREITLACLDKSRKDRRLWHICKAKFKTRAPTALVKFILLSRAFVTRYFCL